MNSPTPPIKLACIIDDDDVYIHLIKKIVDLKKLCENLLIFKNGKALYRGSYELFDVDLATFQPLYSSDYAKDKNHVYYKNEITAYDAKTFHNFSRKFNSDKNGVYYNNKLIKEADVTTFNMFYGYGFDKNNFYYNGKIVARSKVDLKK